MKSIAAALLLSLSLPLAAADAPDLQVQTRIRQEGFRNSKVMEFASGLVDSIGPRLTGSPNLKRANEWTRKKLEDFGLSNAHLESWGPFGRGWSYDSVTVRQVVPESVQLLAIPKAWSPSTQGTVRGTPVKVKLETSEDLAKNKGKLAGRIVMLGEPPEVKAHTQVEFVRLDDKALLERQQYEVGKPRFTGEEVLKRRRWARELARFLEEEKVAAVLDPGRGDYDTFLVQAAGSYKTDEPAGAPTVVLSSEQYGRLSRLLDRNEPVEIEVNVQTHYYPDDLNAYNTVAELPGGDKKAEVVMLGAHLDSWHAGTGATDNAAGVAATMEAIRILKSLGVTPRRTIRIALWSGEEQGLLGSRAYVAQHFGSFPVPSDPDEASLGPTMRKTHGAVTTKPEHARLSAYFNLDNGTGKIRGIYAQENAAVRPIFETWLEPLRDLGATIVTMRNTGSTDHIPFDEVGLPGFQFVQDDVEYTTRTHHTNADVYERLQRDDLMQAAVVIATFVWEAANRPELMPRKPMPVDDTVH
ncbi:MAG: M20/M25/M40 family metallo-hydrolase [Acidobacteriota bacterium]